jgi:hypothetical protein
MATRLRWTDTAGDFVSAAPRALAALRQITDPAPPAQKSTQEPQDARNGRDGQNHTQSRDGRLAGSAGGPWSHRAANGRLPRSAMRGRAIADQSAVSASSKQHRQAARVSPPARGFVVSGSAAANPIR